MGKEKLREDSLLEYTSEKNGYHYPKFSSKEVYLTDIKNQIIAANVAILYCMHTGMNSAFSNMIMNEFDIDTISWFASIINIAVPVGAAVCGFIVDKIGRRYTTLAVFVPCILSWFLMCQVQAHQEWLLYFSGFLGGFATGLGSLAAMYVSELTHKKYRAAFTGLLTLYNSSGILLVSVLQIFFTWRQTALIFSVYFLISLLLCFFYVPESPVWLANFKLDLGGAKRSLRWLISNDVVFEDEWTALNESIKSREELGIIQQKTFNLFQPTVYKPMAILLVLFLLQQCTGTYVTVAYIVDMFPRLCPSLGRVITSEIFLMCGIIRSLSTLFGTILSVKVDRKSLIMWSNISTIIICTLIAAILKISYGQPPENNTEIFEWIETILFLSYVFSTCFGIGIVPWSLNSDLWPTEARGVGSATASAFSFIIFFSFSKIFPFVVEKTGIAIMFLFFGVSCMLMAVHIFIFVPVTFGKSFDEIEQSFTKTLNNIDLKEKNQLGSMHT